MKYKILGIASAFLCTLSLYSQTSYEAVKFSQTELNGTARFVGMGGAMGALGGDISTIATNPAGLGLFRRADVMVTAGFDEKRVEMGGISESKTRARLNNVGFVIPFHLEDAGALKFINIGFNYQRRNSFYKDMTLDGMILSNGVSQMNQMRSQAQKVYEVERVNPDAMWIKNYRDVFEDPGIGWLSILGVNSHLISFDNRNNSYIPNQDLLNGALNSDFYSDERGGIDQSDVNVSFNFNDRFYLGATVGFYDVDYTKDTYYSENYESTNLNQLMGYEIFSDNWIHGEGVDFKLGAIVRPFESSSFRLGFAFHTPIFYRLTLSTGSEVGADVVENGGGVQSVTVSSYQNLNGNGVMDRDFKLRTPWLFNLSAGYTIGNNVALGMEYEYEDYSTSKLKDYYGDDLSYENLLSKEMLKGTHTLRIGAEVKVIPELSLRVGYNYTSAAFEKTAYKDLTYYSMTTDTDFTNNQSSNIVTAGVGVKITRDLYLDMAYKYYGQKGDFYAFDGADLQPVKLDYTNHSFLATLGYRF